MIETNYCPRCGEICGFDRWRDAGHRTGDCKKKIDIVFDGPLGPEAGRFVEAEDMRGRGLLVGDWIERPDGYWALRIEVKRG